MEVNSCNIIKEETVPCELCGELTTFIGTKRCNGCWELEWRIKDNPKLARQILNKIEGEG